MDWGITDWILTGIINILLFMFVFFTRIMSVLVDIRRAVEGIHIILKETPPSKGF